MAGFPDFASGAGLVLSGLAINQANVLFAPQAIQAFSGQILRQGYEIQIVLSTQVTGSQPAPFRIQMVWQDSATGIVVEKQNWWIYAGDQTGAHTILGRGPAGGNKLTVQFDNFLAAAPSVFVSCTVLDVSRDYLQHDWQTDDTTGVVFPGMTSPVTDLVSGIIATTTGISVPASSSVTRVLPVYFGPAFYLFETASPAALSELEVRPNADQNFGTIDVLDVTTIAGQPKSGEFWMTRAQHQLVLSNTDTVARTVNFALVVAPNRY